MKGKETKFLFSFLFVCNEVERERNEKERKRSGICVLFVCFFLLLFHSAKFMLSFLSSVVIPL